MTTLPNVRKLFIPDPGYMIAEIDLAGADAQVVAWEAGDEDLKDAFRKGLKVHLKNARDVFPEKTTMLSDEEIVKQSGPGGIYYNCKRAVHATNYGGKPPTIASVLKWKISEAESFQNRWFTLHPKIKEQIQRVEHELYLTRTVRNRFGYRRIYFDRTEGLLGQALAWVPQSTVALCTFKAARNMEKHAPWAEILLQVHDSLVFQFRYSDERRLPSLRPLVEIPIPYDDPLVIPWGLKVSSKSWGDAESRKWE